MVINQLAQTGAHAHHVENSIQTMDILSTPSLAWGPESENRAQKAILYLRAHIPKTGWNHWDRSTLFP